MTISLPPGRFEIALLHDTTFDARWLDIRREGEGHALVEDDKVVIEQRFEVIVEAPEQPGTH